MDRKLFEEQFTVLLEKYADLLVGDSSVEMVEQIKLWAIYQQISRSMPPLTKHWGESHPEARVEIRELFERVKALNEQLRERTSHGPH